jgi:protein tyrosine/serine phosphatase
MRTSRLAVSCSLFVVCACAAPTARDRQERPTTHAQAIDDAPIANFARVRDGLYRGARPGDDGLQYLVGLGVKTIVDLEIGDLVEATPGDIAHEAQVAHDLGLDFVRNPMSAFTPFVDEAAMNATLALLADTNRQPIYVHCRHGQDRTGLVIGLERVFDEGWDPGDAHDEMLAFGFHTAFWGLNHYFEEKTGWED